jgi:acetyl esterase
VEDSYSALLWVFDNIQELGGDPNLVYTSGNSAGANLATVMVRRLRDSSRKEKIAAEVLRVPVTCHPSVFPPALAASTSSYQKFTDVPILPKRVMDDFWEFYNPGAEVTSLDCSPLLADEFRDFPPTYISVCGCDPLRDQGFEYAKKLDAAGVDVKFEVMPGYPHGDISQGKLIIGHNMWPQIKGCGEAMTLFIDAMKWAIGQAKHKSA